MSKDTVTNENTKSRILLVDDDPTVQQYLGDTIRLLGFTCEVASDGLEALEFLKQASYPLVITDIQMPRMHGMELLHQVRCLYPATEVIVITGFSFEYTLTDVVNAGATDFLLKPFGQGELEAKIIRVMRDQERRRQESAAPLTRPPHARARKSKEDEELRSTINGIVAATGQILNTSLSEEQHACLHSVHLAATSLLTLAGTRSDQEQSQVRRTEGQAGLFDLEQVIQAAMAAVNGEGADPTVSPITYRLKMANTCFFCGDGDTLRRILLPLLRHAKQSSLGDPIILQVEQTKEEGAELTLRFCILSPGFWLAAGKWADDGQPSPAVGTRLSLADCQKLVHQLSGEFWLESEAGIGSALYFTAKVSRPGLSPLTLPFSPHRQNTPDRVSGRSRGKYHD